MSNMWFVKNWFRVGNKISWRLSFYTLGGFLYLYEPLRFEIFYKAAEKKHAFILNSLETDFAYVIDKYRRVKDPEEKKRRRTVWTLWWQGEETAPALVKACLKKFRENCEEVVVLTKDNIGEYITLPDYILKKKDEGIITFAQLSDIIRFALLEKYGGLWLDSTIYLSARLPEEAFTGNLYTLHTNYSKNAFVQHNLYHGFVFGSVRHGKLSSFIKEMFFEYWKQKDVLIDYLMIDYLIMIAYRNFPEVKEEIDNLHFTSERLYDLVGLLNEPYDADEFKKLEAECLCSKLNWHPKYKTTAKGRQTYYAHLVEAVE